MQWPVQFSEFGASIADGSGHFLPLLRMRRCETASFSTGFSNTFPPPACPSPEMRSGQRFAYPARRDSAAILELAVQILRKVAALKPGPAQSPVEEEAPESIVPRYRIKSMRGTVIAPAAGLLGPPAAPGLPVRRTWRGGRWPTSAWSGQRAQRMLASVRPSPCPRP
jgi:hypothetical protein